MRLTRVDLPTLGRPMMAILMPSFSLGPGMRLASWPSATSSSSSGRSLSSGASGSGWYSSPRASWSIWVMPRPWAAAIGSASPRPSGLNSARARSGSTVSTLFATRKLRLFRLRRCSAIIWSAAVMPARESTMNSTASASSMACSDCSAIFASMPSSSPEIPPVSMTMNFLPCHLASPYWRSRVRPAYSATMASRVLVRRLNRVDLPTFGRPTRAITGTMRLSRKFQNFRKRDGRYRVRAAAGVQHTA
ncbi:hypothetical protein D9M68_200540 [compost metagenome]